MSDSQQQPGGATAATTTVEDAPLRDWAKGKVNLDDLSIDDTRKAQFSDLIGELAQIAKTFGTPSTVSEDLRETIANLRGEIDKRLSTRVNAILHAPAFQKLESTWRGLKYLVDNAPGRDDVKVRVLDVSKDEVAQSFKTAKGERIVANPLYKQFYSLAIDRYGEAPYACIVADYQFDQSGRDIDILRGLASIGAATMAPVLSSASPKIVSEDTGSWAAAANLVEYSSLMSDDEHAEWKDLRESDDARYLALTLPRVLARRPYGKKGEEVKTFAFEEEIKGTGPENFVWSNAAYALAGRILDSFASTGWGANIVGPVAGGTVRGLPTYMYEDVARGVKTPVCPAEAPLTDAQGRQLCAEGLVPLIYKSSSAEACFFEAPTVQKPKKYGSDKLTKDAQVAADLPSVLSIARFAQAVKKMGVYYCGQSKTATQLTNDLGNYLSKFKNLEPDGGDQQAKAEKPLADFEVICEQDPRNEGYFNVKVRLQLLTKVKGLNTYMYFSSKLNKST